MMQSADKISRFSATHLNDSLRWRSQSTMCFPKKIGKSWRSFAERGGWNATRHLRSSLICSSFLLPWSYCLLYIIRLEQGDMLIFIHKCIRKFLHWVKVLMLQSLHPGKLVGSSINKVPHQTVFLTTIIYNCNSGSPQQWTRHLFWCWLFTKLGWVHEVVPFEVVKTTSQLRPENFSNLLQLYSGELPCVSMWSLICGRTNGWVTVSWLKN